MLDINKLPRQSLSRKYRVLVQNQQAKLYTNHSTLVETNLTYRAALAYLDNFQKIWEALEIPVVRIRAICTATMEDGKFFRIWFELER